MAIKINMPASDGTSPSTANPGQALPTLMLGAIGVVFGDIGTSPLYAMKESFIGPHPLAVDRLHIFGVLSLVFWTLTMIVSLKYVMVAMRADNNGEGGSFALLALVSKHLNDKRKATLTILGVLAAALFYGCLLYTSPSPRDRQKSRMPSSA